MYLLILFTLAEKGKCQNETNSLLSDLHLVQLLNTNIEHIIINPLQISIE